MQDGMGKPCQAPQAGRVVEVADDLRHAQCRQGGVPLPYQGIDAPPARQLGQGPSRYVAATNNQQSLHRTIIACPTE